MADWFYLAYCLPGLSRLSQMVGFPSFVRLNDITLHVYTTFSLSIQLSKNIWVVPYFGYSKTPTYVPSSCELSKMRTCTPAPVCQLLYCTTVLFKVLYCKITNVYFFVCFLCTYYLCEKYYKPIIVQYYIADCVSWVPRLILLEL